MWQRFTERARRIVFFAQEEAAKLTETLVLPDHLLLALLRERESVAGQILVALEVDLDRLHKDLLERVPRGQGDLSQDMQLTPLAKRAIDLAYQEARSLNNDYIGTEHLLLGLARSSRTLVSNLLSVHGADADRIRDAIMQIQGVPPGAATQDILQEQLSHLPFRDLYRVLSAAGAMAASDRKPSTTREHLFIALLRPGTTAARILGTAGASLDELRGALEPRGWLQPQNPGSGAPLDPEARQVLARMFERFACSADRQVDSRHLLLALVDEEPVKAILSREGINLERLRELLDKSDG